MSDVLELISLIKSLYDQRVGNSPDVAEFLKKIRDGTVTFSDVLDYSGIVGSLLTLTAKEELDEEYPSGAPPDTIREVMLARLQEVCEDVLERAATVQRNVNETAGIGLAPVNVSVDTPRLRDLAKHISETRFGDDTEKLVTNLTNSQVDETIRQNADYQNRSGLETLVSRYYDGIGVNHRRDDCQWCLARAGVDVPYKEALSRGMFQRHPGCGCKLEYRTEKKHTYQSGWTRNQWIDADDVLSRRRNYGL